MPGKNNSSLDPETLRQKLKVKHLEVKNSFKQRHSEADQYLKSKGLDPGRIREHSSRLLAAGTLASALSLSAPSVSLLPPPHEIIEKSKTAISIPAMTKAVHLRQALTDTLPDKVRPLTQQEEKYLEKVVSELTGIPAKATLEGEHLNTVYGRIGAEQHLIRYPGDTLADHAPKGNDYGADRPEEMLREGMAPGLGAWGYFAPSREALTPDLVETERWYAVVQTLYLPDWNTRQPYLKDWYKYRKVLIVNTENGKAVVGSIADSGPAAWTGKHFGGSPAVMDYLGGPRYKAGPVLLFFVDDPENKIPLGPVEYNDF